MTDKRRALEKSLRTRAKRQKEQAVAIKSSDKAKAKHLRELSKKNLAKAKDINLALRAEKKGISKGEQKILDQLRATKAQETKKAKRTQYNVSDYIPVGDNGANDAYWQAYIDTCMEYATHGKSTKGYKLKILKTPVATNLRSWLSKTPSMYGVSVVGQACQLALENDLYIWDEWIYASDQDGSLSQQTLLILEEYVTRVDPEHERTNYDEEELGFDEDTGFNYVD